MGTHPIFESDFDCLTVFRKRMFRLVRQSTRALTTINKAARVSMLNPAKVNAVSVRFMDPRPLTITEVSDRVFYVLSVFDKIDTEKLSLDCRFDKDLGLDSLDTTEIALQLEREFQYEITVEQMDLLLTPREIIDFLCDMMDINH